MYNDDRRILASDELIAGDVGVPSDELIAGHVGVGAHDTRKLYICLYERDSELLS